MPSDEKSEEQYLTRNERITLAYGYSGGIATVGLAEIYKAFVSNAAYISGTANFLTGIALFLAFYVYYTRFKTE